MFLGDLDSVIEAHHQALHAFVNGDPRPVLSLFSERDDVTLANPLGPARRGRMEVEKAIEEATAAANFKDGSMRFEEVARYSTSELAYVHDIQRPRRMRRVARTLFGYRSGSRPSSGVKETLGRSRSATLTRSRALDP